MNINQIQEEIAENILLRANAIHEQYGEESVYEYLNSLTEEEKQIIEASGALGTIGSGLKTIGKTTPVISGAMEFANRKFSKGQDLGTATKGALATTAGSTLGLGLGALGGPLAPVTMPVGAVIGAGVGSWLYDKYKNIPNPDHERKGPPKITVKNNQGKDVKVNDYTIQGGEQGGPNLRDTSPSPGITPSTDYNVTPIDRGTGGSATYPSNATKSWTEVKKPQIQRVPVQESQRNLKDFRTLQEKIMKKEYEGNVFQKKSVKEYVDWSHVIIPSTKQISQGTQKHGGEGTQSGPSVDTSQNKDTRVTRGGEPVQTPKPDAKPIQLQTRQRHDIEYKDRNPEADLPYINPKSIFGIETPDFITKTGKGHEKNIDPATITGGREPGAPDFRPTGDYKTVQDMLQFNAPWLVQQSRGQGRTTTSKTPESPIQAPQLTTAIEPEKKPPKQSEVQKSTPSVTDKNVDAPTKNNSDNQKQTDFASKEFKRQEAIQKNNISKSVTEPETRSKSSSSKLSKSKQPKEFEDLPPGEIVRLSLGGQPFSKKASLKEFRILQEKIMRKGQ